MNCYKCGAPLTDDLCPSCGADNNQFKPIERISIRHYNKGLSFAKKNNMTNAVKCLKNAIEIDSYNINALNLLGLCYYKLGVISEATRYWIESCCIREENNLAKDYLQTVEGNLNAREYLNDSIKKYNNSLVASKSENNDMAILQLKKAIELNPNFVQAKNLLALNYIKQNQNVEAKELLDEVLTVDTGNEIAIKLAASIGSINIVERKTARFDTTQKLESFSNPTVAPEFKRTNNKIGNAIAFFAGAIIVTLFMTFLILPSMENENEAQIAQMQTTIDDYTTQLAEKDSEIANLNTQLDSANTELNNITYEYRLSQNQNLLESASNNYDNGNYTEAYADINDIDDYYLNDEQKQEYAVLKNSIDERAGQEYYNDGYSLYNRGYYEEAITSLNSAYEIAPYASYADECLYYIGRSYEKLGDNVNAAKYFNIIITDYPDSNMNSYAVNRLPRVQ